MQQLYVYYRVDPARRAAALAAVERLGHALGARGLRPPRLMRRPDLTSQGLETWMEVYEAVDDSTPAAISAAVAESGLAAVLDGERHVEIFVDIDIG